MGDDFTFTIQIPCDDDGFVLMRCPQCGELFKLRPADYEADDVAEVFCPSCGGVSESYLTDDVIELAEAIAMNSVMESIHKGMKQLERRTRSKTVSFKAGKPPKKETEPALKPSVDALTVATCESCSRQSKISPLLKMSAFICPFCGVSNFNER